MTTFLELGVDQDMVDSLTDQGIIDAFPIQEQTIPLALSGQDIIGQAKTGTGKTFGFGLPLLQRVGADPVDGVQALVVVPTRELAVQVYEDLELAAKNRAATVVPIYGGKAYEGQIEQLKAGAQVVVGTPGRLLDLANQRLLDLSKVREMVLDEADKMLDLGFLADIEKLFSLTPPVRHTMLFSATMPGTIVTLARRFMSNPIHIRATDPDEGAAQANIEHIVYRAHSLDKDEVIGRILQAEGRGKTVVFMRTKRAAAKLQEELVDRGFSAVSVHGDLNQEQRERAMATFKAGKKDILIATDVAARGIDVDDVTHVINHTVPDDEKTYLHRVGRTGRAGRTGIAVTFVDWDDMHKWALINKALEFGIPEPLETYSSSPHLFADLKIAEGTKGRLKATPVKDRAPRERSESRGGRTGGADRASSSGASGSGASGEGAGDGARKRTRRRTRSANPLGQGRHEAHGHEQHGHDAEGGGEPGAPLTPADALAASGETAPPKRRRRRRRGGSGSGESTASVTTADATAAEAKPGDDAPVQAGVSAE
ncbi:DEAD/DEAH box helicase [Leucobacter manosquensis]|uniref:DEAD/DEAH box helicase n=1 Tax=Leucobacter manosquensis TaxID=2810611 RepID=A0ABS5M122_9MICO|nr:DEAD/DEAH box helicase [Leucobacter manosquensis]MBS3180898.1 DEAD/DEAH box helicase [Leucobacter manosquensis]